MPSTFDTMVGKRIKKQRMEINYSKNSWRQARIVPIAASKNGSQERRCRERRCYVI